MKNTKHIKTTQKLQQLVFGDRSAFVFLPTSKYTQEIIPSPTTLNMIAKFLSTLEINGYAVNNAHVFFKMTEDDFERFTKEFFKLQENNTKNGFIFRKTFADSMELKDYTDEEWFAIFAQYAITYGWSQEYYNIFGIAPYDSLNSYFDSMPEGVSELQTSGVKHFDVWGKKKLKVLIKDILESKSVLRAQQIKTLETCPVKILAKVAGDSNIIIKETLIKVMTLVGTEKIFEPILKTSTDVLRYVVQAFPRTPDEALEGQLNKTILKSVMIRIPTSIRKVLLLNMEMIGEAKGAKYLAEDMFSYASFWKRLDKYLRFTNDARTRKRYPHYTDAIDLLYTNDRSWTFNGRYSKAKSELNYDEAIRVLAERPGYLLRNLMEFLRMTEGTELPVKVVKEVEKVQEYKNENYSDYYKDTDMWSKIEGLRGGTEKVETPKSPERSRNIVLKDASDFIRNELGDVVSESLNSKLAWQMLENLENPDLYVDQYKRTIQGIDIEYTVPVPAVDLDLAESVFGTLRTIIKEKQGEKNKNLGKIYIDNDVQGYKLQYSGRESTDISYAGEFLSPGTSLSITDIMKAKDITNPILRLGIMWRGKVPGDSVDIDHSLSINDHENVYYGSPVLKVYNKVCITSSGDITSCGGPESTFSTEIVDIDIETCLKNGVSDMVNSAIVYSHNTNIGRYEAYYFMQVISRKQRMMDTQSLTVDLAAVDYAIQIDPDNKEGRGRSYLGFVIDLNNDKVTALNISVKGRDDVYSNVNTENDAFNKVLNNANNRFSIVDVIEASFMDEQITKNIKKANIIISRKSAETLNLRDGVTLLHPGKNGEEIQKLIF